MVQNVIPPISHSKELVLSYPMSEFASRAPSPSRAPSAPPCAPACQPSLLRCEVGRLETRSARCADSTRPDSTSLHLHLPRATRPPASQPSTRAKSGQRRSAQVGPQVSILTKWDAGGMLVHESAPHRYWVLICHARILFSGLRKPLFWSNGRC